MSEKKPIDMLLQTLLEESRTDNQISLPTSQLPEDETQKRHYIRSLMNVRMPRTISAELLHWQNLYLEEERTMKGIVTLADIPPVSEHANDSEISADRHSFPAEKISLWQGDITRLAVGAIVNAANSQLLGCFIPCHRCIDNAIHSAAGMQLRNACDRIMTKRRALYGNTYEEPTGTATLTEAYQLPCDYVIHTVGPIVADTLTDALRLDLRNCYENVLRCCLENHITSVAFCCISTGEFHFPNEEAADIAVETVTKFLQAHGDSFERIIFNVFQERDKLLYEKRLNGR